MHQFHKFKSNKKFSKTSFNFLLKIKTYFSQLDKNEFLPKANSGSTTTTTTTTTTTQQRVLKSKNNNLPPNFTQPDQLLSNQQATNKPLLNPEQIKKIDRTSPLTDTFYNSQLKQESIRTAAYVIPDHGSVPETPLGSVSNDKKLVKSSHQITPLKNQQRSRSFDYPEPEHRNDAQETNLSSVKPMIHKIQKVNKFPTRDETLKPGNYTTEINANVTKKPEDKTLETLPQHEFILNKKDGSLLMSQKLNENDEDNSTNDDPATHMTTSEYSMKPSPVFRADEKQVHFVKELETVVNAHEGSPCRLEFETAGYPEPAITWLKDNMHVNNSPDTRITSNAGLHALVIPEVFPEDAGFYKALASTPLGTLETCCELVVQGF